MRVTFLTNSPSKQIFQFNTENAHKVCGVRSKLLIMAQGDINGMVLAS